jgi:hypothetical protein
MKAEKNKLEFGGNNGMYWLTDIKKLSTQLIVYV